MRYKRAYLEITNRCNLDCSFCPKTRRASKFLSKEEFILALDQISRVTSYLQLHVMGEPLLHPELSCFLELAHEKNMKINLTTNGTLLKGNTAQILLNAPAVHKVCVSLHSLEANQKTSLSLDEYLCQIVDFSQKASSQGILVMLRLWNLDGENTVGQRQWNERILSELSRLFHLAQPVEQSFSETRNVTLAPGVYLHFAEKFEWPDLEGNLSPQTVFCRGLRDHFAVLCDGTVVPCCLDSEGTIPLGNLFVQPLEQILNSQRAVALYRGFSDRKPTEELCRHCGYASRFQK